MRKTIFEGFQLSWNFMVQEIGSRCMLHQVWKWAFKDIGKDYEPFLVLS